MSYFLGFSNILMYFYPINIATTFFVSLVMRNRENEFFMNFTLLRYLPMTIDIHPIVIFTISILFFVKILKFAC